MLLQLDILSGQGHETRVFDDAKPEDRNILGRTAEDLLSLGYRLFLRDPDGTHRKIFGYDDERQAWITSLKPHHFAAGSMALALPVVVGG